MTRYDCRGSLSINIDAVNGTAKIIFQHSFPHPPYNDKRITQDAQDAIKRWYETGLRRPSAVHRALVKEGKAKNLTQNQVRTFFSTLSE